MAQRRRSSHLETYRGRSESLTVDLELPSDVADLESKAAADEKSGLLGGMSARSWFDEIKVTWTLAWPIYGTFLLQVGPAIVNVIFLGHLEDKLALAAGTLATMFIQISANSIFMGLATAMDTLASQAYGSGQVEKVGVLLQRGLIILYLFSIPILISWLYTEKLLIMCKQDPVISKMAGDFIFYYIPGLWAMATYEPLKKYLQAQGVVKPAMYIAVFSNIWHVFVNWLFIFGLGWGFLGAPLARITTQWMNVFVMLAYMKWTGAGRDAWPGFTKDAFKEWGIFMQLAIPGLLMTCAEYWAFEIQTLGSGYFGAAYLSGQSVIVQIIQYTILLPFGVAVAATIRVGNFLGKNAPDEARRAAISSLMLSFIAAIIAGILFLVLHRIIPRIFTSWDEAIDVAAETIPLIAFMEIFDSLQICASGVLRGAGMQVTGFLLNIVAYYVIGLPLGFFFAFKLDRKIYGLYEGLCIALILVSIAAVYIVVRIDWRKECDKAQERLRDGGDEAPLIRH